MMASLTALVVATAILVAIPGPNVALIVANSLRFGFGAGAKTVFDTTAGVAVQLPLVVAGMALQVGQECLCCATPAHCLEVRLPQR